MSRTAAGHNRSSFFYLSMRLSLCLVVISCVACPSLVSADGLTVKGAWVRLPPPGANAAGYLTFVNTGDEPARIVGVASDVATRTELHRSWVEDGVARMRPVDTVEVPAHGELVLEPKGLHVMLIRPEPLHEGQQVALTFTLDGGVELRVEVEVRRAAAGAASDHGDHSGH